MTFDLFGFCIQLYYGLYNLILCFVIWTVIMTNDFCLLNLCSNQKKNFSSENIIDSEIE